MTNMYFPIGDRLMAIGYDQLKSLEPTNVESLVDEVDIAVTLHWKNSPPSRVSWSVDAWNEGLVGQWPVDDHPRPELAIVDASDRWKDIVGTRLVHFRFSWSVSPHSLPWAVNLRFETGDHLVIALGELLNGEPSYMPDTLLVTGSAEFAGAYHHPAAISSAWGDELRN